jgi:phospholipid transport system substrate-binding protein
MKIKRLGVLSGWSFILALAVNLIIWVPQGKSAGPAEDVKSLIEQVQTILQSRPESGQRLELIEKAIVKHLDSLEIAKGMLGPTWSTLNAGQKDEFVYLIRQLAQTCCAKYFEKLGNAKVNYEGESHNGNSSEVRIVVLRPNDKIPVSFLLLQKPEGWLIHDLKIDGVSMVSNYRSQFQRAIQTFSYAGLLGRLKAQVKAEHLG